MRTHTENRGFSLVELSIVLVILGLLTGGILSGQSLIRASELRSVVGEYERYIAAVHSFRDRYMALPGDMTNATQFWGKSAAFCNSHTGTAAIPGTCNGGGDGRLQKPAAVNATGEIFRFWQHLSLAGLIEGTYSGNAGPLDEYDMVVGDNIPAAKISGGSWGMREYYPGIGDTTTMFAISPYGHWLQLGRDVSTDNTTAILRPEEAWNIDSKMDDGRPARGKLLARLYGSCTTATAGTNLDADYRLDSSSIGCVLNFPHPF